MLPGFRFLFGAIVLSISILVFGLGAAALLRAAHDEFASNSSLRVAPEPKFAHRDEVPGEPSRQLETPTLAVLRVEPEPEQAEIAESLPEATAPAEPAASAPAQDEPGNIAALAPATSDPPEPGKSQNPVEESSVQSEAPPAPAPDPALEAGIAAAEQFLSPANEAVASEQAVAPSAPDAGIVTGSVTPDGPPVAIETPPPAKAASAKPDPDAARKRRQARRAKERRRAALRARQAAAQQQVANPFAQPTIPTRSR